MTSIYTTEITSNSVKSDNPIHQRLLKAYIIAQNQVTGDLLEVGCGEGRGVDLLLPAVKSYSAIDKNGGVIDKLQKNYPQAHFRKGNIPPLSAYKDNSFDCVVSFQVIEHIQNDQLFLQEIRRVLKPNGWVMISTPNRNLSLSRNPWHIREYTGAELATLAQKIFAKIEMKGIMGSEKVKQYHERNKKSVNKIMRWDVLNLQYKLPAFALKIPYEILNRFNRNKLEKDDDELVRSILHSDYILTDNTTEALDLFLVAYK